MPPEDQVDISRLFELNRALMLESRSLSEPEMHFIQRCARNYLLSEFLPSMTFIKKAVHRFKEEQRRAAPAAQPAPAAAMMDVHDPAFLSFREKAAERLQGLKPVEALERETPGATEAMARSASEIIPRMKSWPCLQSPALSAKQIAYLDFIERYLSEESQCFNQFRRVFLWAEGHLGDFTEERLLIHYELYCCAALPPEADLGPYQWSYIFIESTRLLYVDGNSRTEEAPIADLEHFKRELDAITKTDDNRYRLTEAQVGALITANGGHKPHTEASILHARQSIMPGILEDGRTAHEDDRRIIFDEAGPGNWYSCWPGLTDRLEDGIGSYWRSLEAHQNTWGPYVACLKEGWLAFSKAKDDWVTTHYVPTPALLALTLQACSEEGGYTWKQTVFDCYLLLPDAITRYKEDFKEEIEAEYVKKQQQIHTWIREKMPRSDPSGSLLAVIRWGLWITKEDTDTTTATSKETDAARSSMQLAPDWEARLRAYEKNRWEKKLLFYNERACDEIDTDDEEFQKLTRYFRVSKSPSPIWRLVGLRADWGHLWHARGQGLLQNMARVSGLCIRHLALLIECIGGIDPLLGCIEALVAAPESEAGTHAGKPVPLWSEIQPTLPSLRAEIQACEEAILTQVDIKKTLKLGINFLQTDSEFKQVDLLYVNDKTFAGTLRLRIMNYYARHANLPYIVREMLERNCFTISILIAAFPEIQTNPILRLFALNRALEQEEAEAIAQLRPPLHFEKDLPFLSSILKQVVSENLLFVLRWLHEQGVDFNLQFVDTEEATAPRYCMLLQAILEDSSEIRRYLLDKRLVDPNIEIIGYRHTPLTGKPYLLGEYLNICCTPKPAPSLLEELFYAGGKYAIFTAEHLLEIYKKNQEDPAIFLAIQERCDPLVIKHCEPLVIKTIIRQFCQKEQKVPAHFLRFLLPSLPASTTLSREEHFLLAAFTGDLSTLQRLHAEGVAIDLRIEGPLDFIKADFSIFIRGLHSALWAAIVGGQDAIIDYLLHPEGTWTRLLREARLLERVEAYDSPRAALLAELENKEQRDRILHFCSTATHSCVLQNSTRPPGLAKLGSSACALYQKYYGQKQTHTIEGEFILCFDEIYRRGVTPIEVLGTVAAFLDTPLFQHCLKTQFYESLTKKIEALKSIESRSTGEEKKRANLKLLAIQATLTYFTSWVVDSIEIGWNKRKADPLDCLRERLLPKLQALRDKANAPEQIRSPRSFRLRQVGAVTLGSATVFALFFKSYRNQFLLTDTARRIEQARQSAALQLSKRPLRTEPMDWDTLWLAPISLSSKLLDHTDKIWYGGHCVGFLSLIGALVFTCIIIPVALGASLVLASIPSANALFFYGLKKVRDNVLHLWQHKKPLRSLLCLGAIGGGVVIGVLKGMALGALVGSLLPGIGTAAGAIIGAVFGALISASASALIAKQAIKKIVGLKSKWVDKKNYISATNPKKYELCLTVRKTYEERGINCDAFLRDLREQKNKISFFRCFFRSSAHCKRNAWNALLTELKEEPRTNPSVALKTQGGNTTISVTGSRSSFFFKGPDSPWVLQTKKDKTPGESLQTRW